MKKFAFFTLLSICLTAIAVTSGNSRSTAAYVNNIADTTPTTHHTMVHKTVKKTTTSKTKKPVTDSTHKK